MIGEFDFSPYLPISQHGVIGDRRTAALIAADGTLNWFCLPNFDSPSLCSTLLDARSGGYWRFGPVGPEIGQQRYLDNSVVLVTSWQTETGRLELSDFMPWPQNERPQALENCRAVIRRLRCLAGEAQAALQISLKVDFDRVVSVTPSQEGLKFEMGSQWLGLWSGFPLKIEATTYETNTSLSAEPALWYAFGRPSPVH